MYAIFFFGFLPTLNDILACHIAEVVRGRGNMVTARWYRRDGEGKIVTEGRRRRDGDMVREALLNKKNVFFRTLPEKGGGEPPARIF